MKIFLILTLSLYFPLLKAQNCPSRSFAFTKFIGQHRHVRCMKRVNDSFIQDGPEYIYNKKNQLIGKNLFINGVEQLVKKTKTKVPKSVDKYKNWKLFSHGNISFKYPWWWDGSISSDTDSVSQYAYNQTLIDGIKKALSAVLINFKFESVSDKNFIFYPRFSVYEIDTKVSPLQHCRVLLSRSQFTVRQYGKERVLKSNRTTVINKCIAGEKGFYAKLESVFSTSKKIETVTHYWVMKSSKGNLLIVYSDLREMPERNKAVKNIIKSYKSI